MDSPGSQRRIDDRGSDRNRMASRPIHLLVSDIVMPRLNGPDLAQRIVRRRPAIQVLYVSGFANKVAVERGSISQNASFLQKPFRPGTLAQKVRERLDKQP